MMANTYQDKVMREAYSKGAAAARKRRPRTSNPYFNSSLQAAWNAGYDETVVARKGPKARLI